VVLTVAERRNTQKRPTANGSRDARKQPSANGNGIGDLVQSALQQFVALSGETPERVSGVRTTDDGWSVLVDVVELERVPSTTSVMCTYRLDIDEQAHLAGFERVRRFTRASTDGR
jgi:hypothetical protein